MSHIIDHVISVTQNFVPFWFASGKLYIVRWSSRLSSPHAEETRVLRYRPGTLVLLHVSSLLAQSQPVAASAHTLG